MNYDIPAHDLIIESLQSKCVYQEVVKMDPTKRFHLWFNYMELIKVSSEVKLTLSVEDSEDVLRSLNINVDSI